MTDFSNTQLCALLSASEAQELGASAEGEPSANVSTADPVCQWSDETVIVMAYAANRTTDTLKTGSGITIKPTSSAGLPGVQSDNVNDPAVCQVVINLTDHSSMAFAVSVHSDFASKYDRCDVAHKFADVVVPKIKQG